MAGNEARLANGQRWTAQQFVDHYFEPSASGTPTPVAGRPAPVDVDRSWYMGEGPGRYYHPGMFPIIHRIIDNRNLARGSYALRDLVPNKDEKDPSLTANLSHYTTDVRSADYLLRALVFGNESARISGQVEVNPDGSKTFKKIEIRPLDTNFDFEHNTRNVPLEIARGIARRQYDAENQGISYDIQYRGPGPNSGSGRVYEPFTDSQLNAALHKGFVYPRSAPAWLLPSITGKLPTVMPFASPTDRSPSGTDIRNWIASLAGLDSPNRTQPESTPETDSNPVPRLARVDRNNSPASPVASFDNRNSFDNRFENWTSSPEGTTPRNPNFPVPPPESGRPLGFFTGKPMPLWTTPPPLGGSAR